MEGNRGPLISVIINCHNGEEYLKKTIDSVIAQSYRNWEIIFWDNHSTDKSASIFRSIEDVRLRYFFAPKYTSLGEARNLAVENASGEWVGFLDSDDLWSPDKLQRQVEIIESEDSSLGMVYGQCLVIPGCRKRELRSSWTIRQARYSRKTVLRKLPEGVIFEKLLKLNFVPLLTAIFRVTDFKRLGGITSSYEQAEDYELFLKISKKSRVRAVQGVVGYYRAHEGNSSINKESQCFDEVLDIIKKYAPNELVAGALGYQFTAYALTLMQDGKVLQGLHSLLIKGSFYNVLKILIRRVFRVIY